MARLASGPRLRGRDMELRALGEALDRAASGGSAIVLVEGEAGIGKTRLLAETVEQARARSLRVAAGRAEELERTRPFGLLADTLGCAVVVGPAPRRHRRAPGDPYRRPGSDDGEQRPGPAVPGG
jgi:hypothetical protein